MSFRSFQRSVSNSFRFGIFMFIKLPSAFFSGVRLRSLDEQRCITSVPYKWFSQNPFRSTYFACQAMAAEMSTGLLCMGHLHQSDPAVSMLVVKVEATYTKKATSRTYFTCSDGDRVKAVIDLAKTTGEPQVIECISTGKDKAGDVISIFKITWSFKAKSGLASVTS